MTLLRNFPFITVVLVIVIALLGWLGLEIPPQFFLAAPVQAPQPKPVVPMTGLLAPVDQVQGDMMPLMHTALP